MGRAMNKIIDGLSIAAGMAFVALALITTVEVIGRKFFNFSLQGVDEMGGYVYAIGSAIGFVAAYTANIHIRVDLIVSRLPVSARAVLNLASHVLLACFILFLTWRATAQFLDSWHLGALAPTPLRTPLVFPQGIWLAMLVLFCVVLIAKLVIAVKLFTQPGGAEAAARLLDIAPATEELETELASLRQRRSDGVDR